MTNRAKLTCLYVNKYKNDKPSNKLITSCKAIITIHVET